MVSSGGVSICGECVVRTVQRMRRTQRPAEVASPAPSALADEAEEARRRERADRVAFRDPQELIDLSVDSSDEDSTA